MAVREEIDASAVESWVALVLEEMGRRRTEIDGLNVFPVPDGDTGTNMFLTIESAATELQRAKLTGVDDPYDLGTAFAKGALLGARGNSGVIVSQFIRGMLAKRNDESVPDGEWLARALRRAADGAWAAVSAPKEGTILSVAKAAADAAEAEVAAGRSSLVDVAKAQAAAAREALALTPEQLPVLKRAGVVDSGGRGLVVLTDALAEVVTGVHRTLPEFERVVVPADEAQEEEGYAGPEYEVMFLLETEDDASVEPLKERLAALGDSLVVVGGDGLWNVHVHVDDAGAAIEAAMAAGRPYRFKVTYLQSLPHGAAIPGRAIVVVVHGPGLNEVLSEAGDVVVVPSPPFGRPSTAELLDGINARGVQEIIVLPSDKDTRPVAEAAASHARDKGLRVAVIPTRSIVQSIAAVSVHNAAAPFDDDVVSMTRAVGATKYGAVTTAARRAVTSAGDCEVGDEIGLISGDIVEIGSDTADVTRRVLRRMLSNGGELVTMVTGEDAGEEMVDQLVTWVERAYPGIEVITYDGQQPRWPVIVGVE